MRKIFIIFLTLVLTLCSFNTSIAEEESLSPTVGIIIELDKIEENINKNTDEAKSHLMKLREYVYAWASELTVQNLYTSRVFDIIELAGIGIEKNDVDYIVKARRVFYEILSGSPNIIPESDHS